jgi:hypothetical protein
MDCSTFWASDAPMALLAVHGPVDAQVDTISLIFRERLLHVLGLNSRALLLAFLFLPSYSADTTVKVKSGARPRSACAAVSAAAPTVAWPERYGE